MDNSLVVRIDLAAAEPAYRQIVAAIRAFLVQGRLRPGDQLPTVRQLAADLAVHHNTVAEAYRQLADEGWLDLRRRRGAMVNERHAPHVPSPEARGSFLRLLEERIAKALADGVDAFDIASELERIALELRQRRAAPMK